MRLTAAVATVLLLIFPGPAPAAAQHAHQDTLVGTIQTWDATQRELKVLAGMGMAIRVTAFSVPSGTPATEAGSPLSLASLKPGDIIRVVGGSHERRVAYSIERLARAGGEL